MQGLGELLLRSTIYESQMCISDYIYIWLPITQTFSRNQEEFFLETELKNKAWLINTGLNIVFKLD